MAAKFTLTVNGKPVQVEAEPDTPLLYILRNDLALNGAKFGCGLGQCGACTVVIGGNAIRSCQLPLGMVGTQPIKTIEGLGTIDTPHPIQAAFITEQAAQCGYCINGMIMSTHALLQRSKRPSPSEIREALAGNLCRCGTHHRILRAIARAAETMRGPAESKGGNCDRDAHPPDLRRCPRRDLVSFRFGRPLLAADAPPRLPGSLNGNRLLDAWLQIDSRRHGDRLHRQGRARPRRDYGADADRRGGTRSAARALRMVPALTGDSPDEGHTSGSQSIENSGTALRLACAEARAILIERAAAQLGAPADRSDRCDGFVIGAGRQAVGYGEVVDGAMFHREATAKVQPKAVKDYQPRRQIGAAARYPGEGHGRRRLCAGYAACPAWSSAASCDRRAIGATSTDIDGSPCERCRVSSRWWRRRIPRPRRRARRAGDRGARALAQRAKWTRDAGPARPPSSPTGCGRRRRRQHRPRAAAAAAPAAKQVEASYSGPMSRMPDRPLLRRRAAHRKDKSSLVAYAGDLSAA